MANPLATLNKLPSEILHRVFGFVRTLEAHASLSQTNKKFRALYLAKGDVYWKALCLGSGYGKSVIHEKNNWTEHAAALVYHSRNCAVCKSCVEAVGNIDLSALNSSPPQVEVLETKNFKKMSKETAKADSTPKLRPFFNARAEFRFDINWDPTERLDRPLIDSSFYEKTQEKKEGESEKSMMDAYEDPNRRLRLHIVAASLLITNIPIDALRIVTSSEAPFGFEEGKRNSGMGKKAMLLDGYEGHILAKPAKNVEGLTCFDVLKTAADVSKPPMAYCIEVLLFDEANLHLASGDMWFVNVR